MSNCLVITCITCDTPNWGVESPNGCACCGMMDWWRAYNTEEECNTAYKKQYPEEFDQNGNYIKK